MAGVGCVMVSSIPKRLQKTDIQVHFEQPENGGGATEFILYPLGNDRSLAVIKFKEDKGGCNFLQSFKTFTFFMRSVYLAIPGLTKLA